MKTSKSKPVESGPSLATQRPKGASCAATAGSASHPWWVRVNWRESDTSIAKQVGISRTAVWAMRKRHKLGSPAKRIKPLTRKAALPVAADLLRRVEKWDALGISEYLPEYAQGPWARLAEEIGELNKRMLSEKRTNAGPPGVR